MPHDALVLLPDQDMVLQELREVLPQLRMAVVAAWERMQQNPIENRVLHQPTTTAISLVDYMVYEAKQLLVGNPRVYFRSDEETWLVVDQRYDLRFKKLSKDGVPTNAETRRQRRITSQAQLPNFSQVRLNIGWGEDKAGDFQVLVSFSTGFGVIGWCVEIREDGVYSLAGQPVLPFEGGLPRFQPPFDLFDIDNNIGEEPARRVRPRRPSAPDHDEVRRRVRPTGQSDTGIGSDDAAPPSERKTIDE